ncbi:MAG TPA: hypothetical protein VHX14_05235 [Thermoanaerobaculia bacterium]|nr:hypothetical protein [Thermoanaerobaculia bacterium]
MNKVILSLLLLQTVTAFAQPTISAEISSGSLPLTNVTPFLPAPAVAMAKDRTGVAIAWLMPGSIGDRISVVRLDVTAHFTGQVQTIPTGSFEPVYVVGPSLAAAPRGDGFTLAWLEIVSISPPVTRAAYCQLDRDLKPSKPAVLLEMPQPATAPAIVRSGKTTWISDGGFAWELRNDGSLSAPLNAGMTASDMTVATDFPQIVALGHFTKGFVCPLACAVNARISHCDCPLVPVTSASLQFTSLYSITASKIFDFETDAAPAVGSNGRDVAIVWLQGAHAQGGQVVMSQFLSPPFAEFPDAVNQYRVLGSRGPESGSTRPDIASDSARYLVVWRTATADGSHDIVGASIDRTGNVIPLSIATSAADERDPSVVSLGDGNFLVAYEKFSGYGERSIAGRLVTFVSRSHATR